MENKNCTVQLLKRQKINSIADGLSEVLEKEYIKFLEQIFFDFEFNLNKAKKRIFD